MGYRLQPKRRTYVPKTGSEKGRPLGISSFEDKLVELSLKRVLEQIYEEIFEDNSYGYRPCRSQHLCLDKLGRTIQQKNVSYIVEADIKGFFDNVNHSWMIKFLEHRIRDPRIIRIVIRMLKGGHNGRWIGKGQRRRNSARLDFIPIAVEHLPALCFGSMV